MWVLVEWNGEKSDIFPSYGILKTKYVLNQENLQYGKFVCVRDKRNKRKRRARVLMVCEGKSLAKEQERQLIKRDIKVRAILAKCMRKFRHPYDITDVRKKKAKTHEAKLVDCLPGPSTECMPKIPNTPTSTSSSSSDSSSPFHVTSGSSSSDTIELRRKNEARQNRKRKKLMQRAPTERSRSRSPHASRKSSLPSHDRRLSRHQMLRSRSMVCGTPKSSGSRKPPKIVYDMFTQTDPERPTPLHKPTVAFFGHFVRELYGHFLTLVSQIEELQKKLGEKPAPQNQSVPNALDSSGSDVVHLPNPEGNSNQNLVEILKGLNVNVQFLGENSRVESDENESSDENTEDSNKNAQELDNNAQNLGENVQELDDTDQDSDDDSQESDKNDQDSDDNDQNPEDNDQDPDDYDLDPDYIDRIVGLNDQIVNFDHIINANDQMAAADADMREIGDIFHDPGENDLQVMNENVPVVAEHPQNVDGNAQMLEGNVPVPVMPEPVLPVPVMPVPVVPVLPMPILPVFAQPREPSPKPRKLEVRRVSAQSTVHGEPSNLAQRHTYGDEDMVAIGHNRTLIPRRLLNDVNWGSYTTATRQLLQAVFPRRVLATHSLSGKPSPAFANHPRKQRLDPRIVDDIVQTVCERCGVERQWVRVVVTTKCTDEARLYRNRRNQQNRNDENQDPEPDPPLHPRVPLEESSSSSDS